MLKERNTEEKLLIIKKRDGLTEGAKWDAQECALMTELIDQKLWEQSSLQSTWALSMCYCDITWYLQSHSRFCCPPQVFIIHHYTPSFSQLYIFWN